VGEVDALSNDFEKSFYQLTGDYKCSSDFDRILLLIIEFLDQQKGNWATSDLMLLKIKLDGMGVSVDDEITIEEFYKYLIRNSSICTKLYQNLSEDGLKELDLFEAPIIKGIEKIIKLNNEERIIYDTLVQELDNAGITYKEDGIKAKLIGTYLMSDAFVDIKQEITTFNFTIELLTNLDLIWDYQKEVLSKEFKDLSLSVAEDIEYEEKEGIELELNREDNKQETLEDILKEEVMDEDMQAFFNRIKGFV